MRKEFDCDVILSVMILMLLDMSRAFIQLRISFTVSLMVRVRIEFINCAS